MVSDGGRKGERWPGDENDSPVASRLSGEDCSVQSCEDLEEGKKVLVSKMEETG